MKYNLMVAGVAISYLMHPAMAGAVEDAAAAA